ncbi:YncE family protein [Roseomonas populi]|uniref:YncE family protein n=1 Tax=Roseomonas populi TaxID=3121582 RepID=A0ABT1X6C5_9PROT|nr:YncE family protein [Roseomonas pecuniae]MCR0983635.1 YncE family protein [Roseomonas pecuniae]
MDREAPALLPARSRRSRTGGGLLPALLALAAGGASAAEVPAVVASHSAAGLELKLEVRPAGGPSLRPGEPAVVALNFTSEGGGPARGLKPAAWAQRESNRPLECRERVRTLIENRLGRRADVDLNAWHIAYASDSGAVQVLDPVGGTSRTRSLAVINLRARPGGWAEDQARDALFVALPDTGEVVEIDTMRWRERRRLAVGGRPARMALDPDGVRLWVGQDGAEGTSNEVVAVDRQSGSVVARLPAGPGPHAIASAGTGRAAVASSAGVSLLREGSSEPLPQLGGGFSDMIFSSLADAMLLLDPREGRVLALGQDGGVVGLWPVAPGAAGLFLEPAGRLLFVPEPGEARVTVIDLARGAVAHRVPLGGAPLSVGFSGTQAYVQSEAGATVSLVALGSLVEAGTPAVTSIAAGESGLVAGEALGPMVASGPGGAAMLIAAPNERVVHYYMEGMAAPAGVIRVPQGRPLAITAVDHALRETAPGRYETQAIFPVGGRYVLPVMVQGGGFLHCFSIDLGGEEGLPLSKRLRLELEEPAGRALHAGAPAPLRMRLRGPSDNGQWREAGDLTVRVVQLAGHWQTSVPLRPLGDGLYEAEAVAPPEAGTVNLYVESPSLGLEPGTLPHIMLQAESP